MKILGKKMFPTHLKLSSLLTSITLLILRLVAGAESILNISRIIHEEMFMMIRDDIYHMVNIQGLVVMMTLMNDDSQVLNLIIHNSAWLPITSPFLAYAWHHLSLDQFWLMMLKKV